MASKSSEGESSEVNDKPLCKSVNFKLILTLFLEGGKSEVLKTHFKSKPDNQWCNIPSSKDLNKSFEKIIKKWRKTGDRRQIINKTTQIISTVGSNTCSSSSCSCSKTFFGGNGGCGFGCKSGTTKNPCCKSKNNNPFSGCACCKN
jgi:hypothetical protein